MTVASAATCRVSSGVSDEFSQFSNEDDKKFEFDFIGSRQHNPLMFVSCSSFRR